MVSIEHMLSVKNHYIPGLLWTNPKITSVAMSVFNLLPILTASSLSYWKSRNGDYLRAVLFAGGRMSALDIVSRHQFSSVTKPQPLPQTTTESLAMAAAHEVSSNCTISSN